MESEYTVRPHKRRRNRLRLTLALVAAGLLALVIFISVQLGPALTALAQAQVKFIVVSIMNDAITRTLDDGFSYSDLINIYDSGNRVYMLQSNARNMNLLAATCIKNAQAEISKIGEQGVEIALGTVSGIPFLSGVGPKIKATFSPIGSVQSSFDSDFLSAGINQTLHRVNLCLSASVMIVMPGNSSEVFVQTEVSIAENIIVGDVPQVFTDVNNEEDMLNLIPNEIPAP